MNPFVIYSQYYIFAVTFFAFNIDYAHSFPDPDPIVPGKEFDECFQFIHVVETARTVEHLGLAQSSYTHFCAVRGTGGNSFCFVVSALADGEIQSVCHEFSLLDLKIIHYKYPELLFHLAVFRNGNLKWYLSCLMRADGEMERFYSFMKYDSRMRNLTELDRAEDLQKQAGVYSNFQIFATNPSIYVDETIEGWKVIHVISADDDARRPVLLFRQGIVNIYTAEEEKVYISLREYPPELFFFTCASANDAKRLSNNLGRYGHDGRAIFRSNPVIFLG